MSPKFHRFLNDAQHYGVKVDLTTNGTRILKPWFDDLLDTLTVVGFSMEGIEEEFEKMRGFKWAHFLKNTSKVAEGRAKQNKDFRIEWRYCAHSDSIHQLPEMLRIAHSVGVDRIQIMPLVPFVKEQKFKMLDYHRSLANDAFAKAREANKKYNIDIEFPPDYDTGGFAESKNPSQDKSFFKKVSTQPDDITMSSCHYPWQTCSINELGVVKPCCVYWRPMGDLRKSTFESIWNGGAYQKLRKKINIKPNRICHNCRMPKFGSEENTSAFQLAQGVHEIIEEVVTFRSPNINFVEATQADKR